MMMNSLIQTEAAMAGALEVQLAGNAYYFGKLYEKPTIGDGIRPVEVEDIRRSNRLLYATAILGAVIFILIGSRCGCIYRETILTFPPESTIAELTQEKGKSAENVCLYSVVRSALRCPQ